jgi:uncharacterized membrane protein YbaN (DUF454 family)
MSEDSSDKGGARAQRIVLVVLGLICVGLGGLGVVLPLLPTTPFLLLAAYLFARSSDRWHRWLMSHRLLGPYIHAFRGSKGLTFAQKFRMGASFSILFAVSVYLVPGAAIKTLLAAWWLFWIVFIFRIKTTSEPVVESQGTDRNP